MRDVDKLFTTLSGLNQGTSAKKAKPEEFASMRKVHNNVVTTTVRMKLRGLQKSVLGSFDAADAKMLAALWDNRAEILERLKELADDRASVDALLHGPGACAPLLGDLAKSPNSPSAHIADSLELERDREERRVAIRNAATLVDGPGASFIVNHLR